MSIITTILATLVALEHFYIFYLESMATQSDATSRVFNMDKEELTRPSVTSLFKNQGIYNAFAGCVSLVWDLFLTKFGNCNHLCFICAWCSDLRFSDSRQEDYSEARWTRYFDFIEYFTFEIRKPASFRTLVFVGSYPFRRLRASRTL